MAGEAFREEVRSLCVIVELLILSVEYCALRPFQKDSMLDNFSIKVKSDPQLTLTWERAVTGQLVDVVLVFGMWVVAFLKFRQGADDFDSVIILPIFLVIPDLVGLILLLLKRSFSVTHLLISAIMAGAFLMEMFFGFFVPTMGDYDIISILLWFVPALILAGLKYHIWQTTRRVLMETKTTAA